MTTNIFIFHGTEGYPEENWFPWLKQQLEPLGCAVIIPQFPSPPVVPAKLSEWFEVLTDYRQDVDDQTILIGHSLGGVFALRVLETLDKPVKAAIFVGAQVGVQPILNYDRDVSFSGFDFNWGVVKANAGKVTVYQSDDDPYVSLGNGQELAKQLETDLSFIPNAGHFNTAAGYITFPDLLEKVTRIIEQ